LPTEVASTSTWKLLFVDRPFTKVEREIVHSMRKLICELTKGIGLSFAASSRSYNYAKETVIKITMLASLFDFASISRTMPAWFKYHNARLVHDSIT